MEKAIKPMEMSGNLAENWKAWLENFENYLVASESAEKSEKIKCAKLLYYIGEDGIKIAKALYSRRR